jgi:hypothetical protein
MDKAQTTKGKDKYEQHCLPRHPEAGRWILYRTQHHTSRTCRRAAHTLFQMKQRGLYSQVNKKVCQPKHMLGTKKSYPPPVMGLLKVYFKVINKLVLCALKS